jgi:hypothetical protein
LRVSAGEALGASNLHVLSGPRSNRKLAGVFV